MSAGASTFVPTKERVVEQWAAGDMSWPKAIEALVRLGFDPHEARDLLLESEK